MGAKRRPWVLLFLSIVAGLWLVPSAARATHYPQDSSCYDCHALSQSRMVTGTHLIKLSQLTNALGVTSGKPVPCLFCHI